MGRPNMDEASTGTLVNGRGPLAGWQLLHYPEGTVELRHLSTPGYTMLRLDKDYSPDTRARFLQQLARDILTAEEGRA